MTVHSHVRLQFRYLGNRSALTLKPHQKQTYLFRARSFIAKHGVLLVNKSGGGRSPHAMFPRKPTKGFKRAPFASVILVHIAAL